MAIQGSVQKSGGCSEQKKKDMKGVWRCPLCNNLNRRGRKACNMRSCQFPFLRKDVLAEMLARRDSLAASLSKTQCGEVDTETLKLQLLREFAPKIREVQQHSQAISASASDSWATFRKAPTFSQQSSVSTSAGTVCEESLYPFRPAPTPVVSIPAVHSYYASEDSEVYSDFNSFNLYAKVGPEAYLWESDEGSDVYRSYDSYFPWISGAEATFDLWSRIQESAAPKKVDRFRQWLESGRYTVDLS